MMITANCIARTGKKCLLQEEGKGYKQRFSFGIKDRYKTEFQIYANCKHCYNVIYNSVPLSLHDKVSSGKMKAVPRLDFTIETSDETKQILSYFISLLGNNNTLRPYEQFTTGHEKKGAL